MSPIGQQERKVRNGADAVLSELAQIIGGGMQRLIAADRDRAGLSAPRTCDRETPGIGVRERTRPGEPHA
jgi:hypothetical protein